eukprot:TRINITY_DN10661_c0_g3_i4.p1 TRINITY_DN10661_c0_g3~~TRINITY_DN10661_c0_g3_i4.p1  ORF type:complete len:295 (+),score=32.23 TRINITY_DN10661_c0_g3_i4:177-1061(+)
MNSARNIFACCFSKKGQTQSSRNSPEIRRGRRGNTNTTTTPSMREIPTISPSPNLDISLMEANEKREITVITKYLPRTIDFCTSRTERENMDDFKYNCPICFRFFKVILQSKCCQNYMCHFCIEDLNAQLKKNPKQSNTCPFCATECPQYSDVDFKATIKSYTDSPKKDFKIQEIATRKSNFGPKISEWSVGYSPSAQEVRPCQFTEICIQEKIKKTHSLPYPKVTVADERNVQFGIYSDQGYYPDAVDSDLESPRRENDDEFREHMAEDIQRLSLNERAYPLPNFVTRSRNLE